MRKINKLLSKAGFYYYNLLVFITNGNKRFVDKKLIFGALLIGLSSQYGCKSNNQNNNTLQENKENIDIDTTLKNKLNINATDSLNPGICKGKSKIATVAVSSCYLTNNKKQDNTDTHVKIIKQDNKMPDDFFSEPTCYVVFESIPEFSGGDEKRIQFFKDNLIYPQIAKDSGIQGTIYTTFLVDTNGNIRDVKVLRGISKECDKEAVRVVKLMPKWIPGKQNGKAVRVQMNMPIKFTLTDTKK